LLIQQSEGSFLVRRSESNRLDFSLSLKWVFATSLRLLCFIHCCWVLSM